MRFVAYDEQGVSGLAVAASDGGYRGLRADDPGFPGALPALIAAGQGALHAAADRLLRQGRPVDLDAATVLPPLPAPGKIICVGLNYRAHAAETGAKPPAEPMLFTKSSTALAGPYDDVPLPRGSKKMDWEVELALIIGKRARYVDKARWAEYVAGFSLMNDYSEREHQKERGGQFVKGKSHDGFAPLGPLLVTPDELSPANVALELRVNGELMQDGSTSDLIFDVPTLVSHISEFMTLLPGDVISTGTPAGVGMGKTPPRFLKPGDIVDYRGAGLGAARQRIVESV